MKQASEQAEFSLKPCVKTHFHVIILNVITLLNKITFISPIKQHLNKIKLWVYIFFDKCIASKEIYIYIYLTVLMCFFYIYINLGN